VIESLAELALRGGHDILGVQRGVETNEGGTSGRPAPSIVSALGGQSGTGLRVTAEGSMQVSAVNACVRVRAESVASVPLIVYRREGRTKDRDAANPLYRLLHDRPNPWQTSYEWRELMQRHYDLRGNAYSYIERDGVGQVTALYPLDPAKVTVLKSRAWPPEPFYRCSEVPGSPVLPRERVFHLRGMSRDGFIGISPVAEEMEAVGLAQAMEQYGAALFANGGLQRGIFAYDGVLKEDQYKRLRETLDERFGGRRNWGRPGLLDGKWQWLPASMKADEAQFLESRAYQVEDIARLFRMPLLMIGHADKTATYASAEQFFLAFVVHCMMPVWARWEAALKRDLFTDLEGDYYPEFLAQGLLRGDIKTRYAAYAIARQWGWLNADEIREFENMNPLPEGAGQMYLTPLNMVEAGKETAALAGEGKQAKRIVDYMEFARLMSRMLGPALETEGADA
jgi:HK97 family phage portal protein